MCKGILYNPCSKCSWFVDSGNRCTHKWFLRRHCSILGKIPSVHHKSRSSHMSCYFEIFHILCSRCILHTCPKFLYSCRSCRNIHFLDIYSFGWISCTPGIWLSSKIRDGHHDAKVLDWDLYTLLPCYNLTLDLRSQPKHRLAFDEFFYWDL